MRCIQILLFIQIAVSAGVLFGLITLLVQYVGLFMLGFHSGLLLGLVGLSLADPWDVRPDSPWVAVGIMIVCGLVMALFNLCLQVRRKCLHYREWIKQCLAFISHFS